MDGKKFVPGGAGGREEKKHDSIVSLMAVLSNDFLTGCPKFFMDRAASYGVSKEELDQIVNLARA